MNKRNGFTTVELIVSFTLVSVIAFFLFQLIFTLKDVFINSGVKTELLRKQAVISERINYDFRTKELLIASKCGDECAEFRFSDGSLKKLSYNRTDGYISYGTHKEKIVEGSKMGNIKLVANTISMPTNLNQLNGILNIKIPIYSKYFKGEDFGVNIVYQYNSFTTSVSGLNITDSVEKKYQVYLIGSENDIKFENIDYKEPGFYLYSAKDGEIFMNSEYVTVKGNVGNEVGKTYQITYTFESGVSNTTASVTRNVTVVKSSYDFAYTGSVQTLVVPVNGTYKLETWGASGGGTSSMKGLGGYTSGSYSLKDGNVLRIFVGGEGKTGTYELPAEGGYNGGGNSGSSDQNLASSGGGSSDIRLSNNHIDSRIIVAGGGGGGGSRCDSSYKCNGGAGGGLSGGIGICSSDTYVGKPGTQTTGGAAASYTTNCTIKASAGTKGNGGVGATYEYSTSRYAGGGGGGGYYGGGGGARYGGGAGGSGYCGTSMNCKIYDGSQTFQSPNGLAYETGHNGNGFVRITLISVEG